MSKDLLVRYNVITQEKASFLAKRSESIIGDLSTAVCSIPFSVRVRNNGTRDTTIETLAIEFTTFTADKLTVTMPPLNTTIPVARVVDIYNANDNALPIPLFYLIFDIAMVEFANTAFKADAQRELFLTSLRANIPGDSNIIDFDKPALVTLRDQYNTNHTATVNLAPLRSLLRTACNE